VPETSGVYLELYDDVITLVEVSDTEYLEIYDGSFGLPTVLPSEALPFTQAGPLAAGIGTIAYPIKGGSFTILSVAARVGGSPSGSSVIVDVNKNGTTIYTTQASRPTIAPAANEAVVGSHDIASLTTGDYLTIDIDGVGSLTPGSHLVVVIRLQRIS